MLKNDSTGSFEKARWFCEFIGLVHIKHENAISAEWLLLLPLVTRCGGVIDLR